jgi:hypothetical protein
MMDGARAACSDETEFINILVTDGVYQSTDAQVQARWSRCSTPASRLT